MIEYARPTGRDTAIAARRLANSAYMCAGAAALMVCLSAALNAHDRSALRPGNDPDEIGTTSAANVLALLSFAPMLAGLIFAIVGLSQRRTLRTWLALAATLAVPAAISIAAY